MINQLKKENSELKIKVEENSNINSIMSMNQGGSRPQEPAFGNPFSVGQNQAYQEIES